MQPSLTGDIVTLRPIARGDYESLFAAASDPLIWAVHPARDRWQEPVFRHYFEDRLLNGDGLTIREKDGGRVIGASCYSLDGRPAGEIEIGWTFLARDYWGGPTNRDVKRLMVGHALAFVDRVIFRVAEANLRSRRALEKIGARLTERTETFEVGGQPVPHVIYEIGRDTGFLDAR